MRAEVPTLSPYTRRLLRPVLNSNRGQVMLFAALTLILKVATVWGGRIKTAQSA